MILVTCIVCEFRSSSAWTLLYGIWEGKKKSLKDTAADFHFTHSSLLALVVVTFQAGAAYYNLDLTNVKYKNNKLSLVEKESVDACMNPNILSDWKKNAVPKRTPRSLMESVWVMHISHRF